ncbi:membrane protein insertase YidC [Methyloligella solikamskensis]|uniref:Membrane protein insertase YidC n=1 Tax=Methyloligella solikamskensis TaxID=1177756 RepID=A0ABW3JCW3_9HYPH
MDENNRNFILAIILSIGVLFAWQFFFALPEQEQQRAEQEQVQQDAQSGPQKPGESPLVEGEIEGQVSPGPGNTESQRSREDALAASPRLKIDSPRLSGSIALKGARLDDLTLKNYRVTVQDDSPNVILLSPAGTPHAYYAESGWVGGSDAKDLKLPDAETVWTKESDGPLTQDSPAVLSYDNGQGLKFTRTISVDDNYMFTIEETVANSGEEPVTLFRYGLVSRHEMPKTEGYYVLHEGLIGVTGDEGLEEIDYDDALEEKPVVYKTKTGWLGITDKYWATTVIPEQGKEFTARFSGTQDRGRARFQTDYLQSGLTIGPGEEKTVQGEVFAGAKEVGVVDAYSEEFGIEKFDLLIDWGWFYFLTKPMFFALDFFYKLVGNFGVAILIVTLCIKLVLFPLANKSYVAMSKMKKLQPEMAKIKERYADDRMKQQQEMMELYKKQKVNPAAGCLPILVQIPIFFALYKVLFVTIEMRHAPFFGWIQDLSAPDPTTVFNLFGLIPWDPPAFLMIGIWPLIMGVTMFVQMKLNPAPPDPVQQKVFTWMPVFFTYLLASFPAGLVIYWAWNNFLSVVQQSFIMHRQGVDIPLLENLGLKKASDKDDEDGAESKSKG